MAADRKAGLLLNRGNHGIDIAARKLNRAVALLADDVVPVSIPAMPVVIAFRAQRGRAQRIAVAPLFQVQLADKAELLQDLERPVHRDQSERRMPRAARFEQVRRACRAG